MIPRDYITELVQRSDIVDVVQSYVQLRHRGRTHTGLCPFHNEKTPSFVVYPETQSFYCFGCGAGGDVITFIKKINNVDYIEAVKFLAGRAGMALPEEDDQTGRLRSHVAQLRSMLEAQRPTGKDMDFLMQEFNRECNTIGSKCTDVRLARIVGEIKAELEKIREQTQNIE